MGLTLSRMVCCIGQKVTGARWISHVVVPSAKLHSSCFLQTVPDIQRTTNSRLDRCPVDLPRRRALGEAALLVLPADSAQHSAVCFASQQLMPTRCKCNTALAQWGHKKQAVGGKKLAQM